MCRELAAVLEAEPADEEKSSKSQKETQEEEAEGLPQRQGRGAPRGYSPPVQTQEPKGT